MFQILILVQFHIFSELSIGFDIVQEIFIILILSIRVLFFRFFVPFLFVFIHHNTLILKFFEFESSFFGIFILESSD